MAAVIYVHVDTVFGFYEVLFHCLVGCWMFQHDCLDTCCFECLICMCFVFCIFTCSAHLSMFHGKAL